jgi:hypothetical protein
MTTTPVFSYSGYVTVYTVSLPPTGDLTLTGTITTDGKLGTLTRADILDWDLTVYSASLSASFEFLGPGHGSAVNSTLRLDSDGGRSPDGAVATATTLTLLSPSGVFDLESAPRNSVWGQAVVTPSPPGGNVEYFRVETTGGYDEVEIGIPFGIQLAHDGVQLPVPFMSDVVQTNKGLTTLSGMSEPDSKVSVFDGSKLLGTVTADGSGNWSLQTKISGGTHQFTEIATDLAGNTGASAAVTYYATGEHKTLTGGSGYDFLIAGHNDTLTGGAGNDTFVFNANFGNHVVVNDFDVNHDILAFSHTLFSSIDPFAQILSLTHDTTAGAVIAVDAHDSITLLGVTVAQLSAHPADFHFF